MVIGDRYQTAELLGQGSFGQTLAAVDRRTGAAVVAKSISLRGLPGWKPFEYFEREVAVLRSLDHPNLPRYLDAFETEADGGAGPVLALIMERIPGESLLAYVQRGHRWPETAARALLETLLETLDYLHRLSPPVIHRDIKPANVLVRPDGTPVLIDFGAVHDARQRASHGSFTVAGTAGYMAPEQAAGNPVPASDLYGLGTALIHVFSHCHPADLPRRGLHLDFRRHLGCSDHLLDVLERLVQPAPDQRFDSAAAALEQLRRPPAPRALAPPAPSPSSPALAAPQRPLARRAPVLPPLVLPEAPRPVIEEATWQIYERASARLRWTTMGGMLAGGCLAVLALAARMPVLIPLLFMGLGGLVAYDHSRSRRRDRELWRTGQVAEARVVSVAADLSFWKGVHTRYARVGYTVTLHGTSYEGALHAYNRESHHVRAGQAVLVVYRPEDPSDQIAVMGE